MALVWDKNAVRDVLNLFGGRIKSIITKGGTVYGEDGVSPHTNGVVDGNNQTIRNEGDNIKH